LKYCPFICLKGPRNALKNDSAGSGVPKGGSNPPPPPKFRSFDKTEPNSQFRGKYINTSVTT
jgi:hypothetical protein